MRKARRYGRRRDKRLPLSAGIGLGVSVFAPPWNGWSSVAQNIQAGAYDKAFQSFVCGWTGIRIGGIGGQKNTEIDIGRTLNPMNLTDAPAWKTLLISALIAKGTRRFIGDPISKIPILGKYVKYA